MYILISAIIYLSNAATVKHSNEISFYVDHSQKNVDVESVIYFDKNNNYIGYVSKYAMYNNFLYTDFGGVFKKIRLKKINYLIDHEFISFPNINHLNSWSLHNYHCNKHNISSKIMVICRYGGDGSYFRAIFSRDGGLMSFEITCEIAKKCRYDLFSGKPVNLR
jgi:hypothetical protein